MWRKASPPLRNSLDLSSVADILKPPSHSALAYMPDDRRVPYKLGRPISAFVVNKKNTFATSVDSISETWL